MGHMLKIWNRENPHKSEMIFDSLLLIFYRLKVINNDQYHTVEGETARARQVIMRNQARRRNK